MSSSPIAAGFVQRHAISRSLFFLALAEGCSVNDREHFEAFLEASIVFGRAAMHRVASRMGKASGGKWLKSFAGNDPVEFFRKHRDFTMKEGPPKVGQIITFNPISRAADLYYFENSSVPATDTVRRHLQALATLVRDAETKFAT